MTYLSRERKSRLRQFQVRKKANKGCDRLIERWEMIDVNDITWKEGQEFDFWCFNGKDVYILRVMKSKRKSFRAVKSEGKQQVMYLMVEWCFRELNQKVFNDLIQYIESNPLPSYRRTRL